MTAHPTTNYPKELPCTTRPPRHPAAPLVISVLIFCALTIIGLRNISAQHAIRCAHGHLGEPACEVRR